MLGITPEANENKVESLITLLCKSLAYFSTVYGSGSFIWKWRTRKRTELKE